MQYDPRCFPKAYSSNTNKTHTFGSVDKIELLIYIFELTGFVKMFATLHTVGKNTKY